MTTVEVTSVGLEGRRWWIATGLVLVVALAMTVPTTGDIGLTWDEPAYRFSQLRSAQWWELLSQARSFDELGKLLDRDGLLFYWPYARHGINFHPPLSGQLSLLTHAIFGNWMRDIPSRRMASVIEYALTMTLAFGFLARRYGSWVGSIAAGSLLCMPRVYGDGHIAGTDTPGLLIWSATALAFWKGLNEPRAWPWRVLVGVLLGLGFVQKMAVVFVIVPLVIWLVVARLPWSFRRADWIDGIVTSGAMLAPLVVALAEILRLAKLFPRPMSTNMYLEHPVTFLPGIILVIPLLVWIVRRWLTWLFPRSPIWGEERPALEIWTSILAFAPVVGWLGCPPWWRESLPRLAHYYLINTDRRGSLPDIQILYLGQIYEYSLPWHNAWLLIGVTVPAAILIASAFGILYALRIVTTDRLPLYFLLHFVTLPVFRMLPTPAHDGVRLFLPTFFFLAAFAGWGAVWLAEGRIRLTRIWVGESWLPKAMMASLVLVPSAWQLIKVHPFELSYYNEFIGGQQGAWGRGFFELTYWYDAFNTQTLAELNKQLPEKVEVDFLNIKTNPSTFIELQSLGDLRPDIRLGWQDSKHFPYVWLLTQDSKASAFTRYLFAMKPWYARKPEQLTGTRVATVADPPAVSRAWALAILTDGRDTRPPDRPRAPDWVRQYAPFLKRFWGEGLTKVARLTPHEPTFAWAKSDPAGMRQAARTLTKQKGQPGDDPGAKRLRAILDRNEKTPDMLFRARAEGLVEAVDILTNRPDLVRKVFTRYSYTELPAEGLPYLDQLPERPH